MIRWGKPTKNKKKRIDPRYFLDETATRDQEASDANNPDAAKHSKDTKE